MSQGREHIAFAAPYMVRITPMHLDQMGGELICQKGAFLCGAKGIQVSIAFQKKMGVGLFGGEGCVLDDPVANCPFCRFDLEAPGFSAILV